MKRLSQARGAAPAARTADSRSIHLSLTSKCRDRGVSFGAHERENLPPGSIRRWYRGAATATTDEEDGDAGIQAS